MIDPTQPAFLLVAHTWFPAVAILLSVLIWGFERVTARRAFRYIYILVAVGSLYALDSLHVYVGRYGMQGLAFVAWDSIASYWLYFYAVAIISFALLSVVGLTHSGFFTTMFCLTLDALFTFFLTQRLY